MLNQSRFLLSDGVKIAYQEWGKGAPRKLLMAHGWLDNSNSFSFLGPYLADNGFHVVAYDHVGHGYSSHLSSGAHYGYPKYVLHMRNVIKCLEWDKMKDFNDKFNIVGHSMGGQVGFFLTAMYPELVQKLVLIDVCGPRMYSSFDMPALLRKCLEVEEKYNLVNEEMVHDCSPTITSRKSYSKVYSTLQEAVDSRVENVKKAPGKQSLSPEAAFAITTRGVKLCNSLYDGGVTHYTQPTVGPVMFRHDSKLTIPFMTTHSHPLLTGVTVEQFTGLVRQLQCPIMGLYGGKIIRGACVCMYR